MLRRVAMFDNAVRVKPGPKGRNAVLDKSLGTPCITMDSMTIAKEIEQEDKFEDMGAQMVREAASKTSYLAGNEIRHDQHDETRLNVIGGIGIS